MNRYREQKDRLEYEAMVRNPETAYLVSNEEFDKQLEEWVEYMTFNGVSPMADLRKKNGHEEPWTIDYFGVGTDTRAEDTGTAGS